jgi:hypothetical protein
MIKDPIESGSFAEECYDVNSVEELLDALLYKVADREELKRKHLTAMEWRRQIAQAIYWKYTNKKVV